MKTLKYKVIKTEKQYDEYCRILHDLDFSNKKKTKDVEDEIDLLIVLIEKWDEEHRNWKELNPVELLQSLMDEHNMKAKDLVELLNVSKGYVSGILNYKKGLSKDVIRKLAEKFKLGHEAFNRPYKLKSIINSHSRKTIAIRKRKKKEYA
jgi:HTH-type transcriptional regulator/antitoxin HigA